MPSRSSVALALAVVASGVGAIQIVSANLPQAAGCRQLHLDFFGGLPLTQARVSGSSPSWFLLDTASTFTFVDAPVAQSLGLRSRGGMTITGGNGSAAAITFADDVAFDVGGVTLTSRVAVMTLQMKYDRPIAGILGAPFFSRFATRLDFAGSTLDVCDPDAFTPPRNAESIPFRIEEEIPMIDVGLQLPRREEIVAPVYVDTAASQAIVLNRPFVAAHRLEEGQRLEHQRAGSLTGSMSYAAVRGASVRIGSRVHTGVIVGFSPSERTNRAGIVGNGILSNYVLVLDYGRRRLHLQQRARARRRTLLAGRFMDLGAEP